MDEKIDQNKQPQPEPKQAPRRPNETGTLQIDGFVKIFDPNTKEVFVEKRA
jgi:hypothetical protein